MKLFNSKDEKNLIGRQLIKYNTVYIILLSLIAALAVALIIRAFLLFEFKTDIFYFLAYFLVLIISLLLLVLVVVIRKKSVSDVLLSRSIHTFSLTLLIWSTVVSYYDAMEGESMVIYLAILVLLGGIIIINPIFYTVSVLTTSLILFIFTKINSDAIHNQLYLDLVIFIVVALFLCYRHYRVSINEYEMNKHLEKLSYHDQLTKVFNRRSLDDTLSSFLKEKQTFLIGMLDLDNFKGINDTYGHALGDEVLIEIANQLKDKFGEMIYRFGGDEFCILDTKIVNSDILNKKI